MKRLYNFVPAFKTLPRKIQHSFKKCCINANISCIGGSKSSVQGRDSTGIDERGCGLVCECGEQSFKEMGWMKGNIMKN